MKGIDFRSFDWDDTDLIEAYERYSEKKNAKNKKKDNKRRKWKVGDYCRAIYPEDKSYYEAKIISLDGDFCTVEFLGYGDTEDIDFFELKKSEGEKARKKQIKESKADSYDDNGSVDWKVGDYCRAIYPEDKSYYEAKIISLNGDFCTVEFLGYGDTGDIDFFELKKSEGEKARKKQIKKSKADSYDNNGFVGTSTSFMTPPTTMHQYPMPSVPQCSSIANKPTFSSMLSSWYMAGYNTGLHYTSMPFMTPPAMLPSPPMPQCPSIANNPTFSSMLISWYMAGYYLGLHYVQKENRGYQRCCSHSNSCCRN